MKSPNLDRIADLAIKRREHLAAIAQIETEMRQALGVEAAPAVEKRGRKTRSDAGVQRIAPQDRIDGMAANAGQVRVVPATGWAAARAEGVTLERTERQNQAMDQPHHGHANHDPDRTPPAEEEVPDFLRRSAPGTIEEKAAAAQDALAK